MRRLDRLESIDTDTAFTLYESFGLPYEVIKEFGGDKTASLTREAFEEKLEAHRQASRAGAEKKFGGHGLILDTGELKAKDQAEMDKVTRLHTATHLLHAALREVLGDEVKQSGSDITPERLRFDFSYPRKLTDEEIRRVEEIANEVVEQDLEGGAAWRCLAARRRRPAPYSSSRQSTATRSRSTTWAKHRGCYQQGVLRRTTCRPHRQDRQDQDHKGRGGRRGSSKN